MGILVDEIPHALLLHKRQQPSLHAEAGRLDSLDAR
jgi:hypothetical protein